MIIRKKLSNDLLFMAPVVVNDLIRLGKNYDGGYIISNKSITEANGMFSFGVNDDWSFDQQWYALKPNDRIQSYDGTISYSRMESNLAQSYKDFFSGHAEHIPVNITSNTGVGSSSFSDAMARMNRDKIFIKMDIEGGEYELTDSILSNASSITGMVVEFHFTANMRDLFCHTIRKYQQYFHIIHIHPNTSCPYANDNFPDVVEISFLNNTLHTAEFLKLDCYMPNLDESNSPNIDDVALYWD